MKNQAKRHEGMMVIPSQYPSTTATIKAEEVKEVEGTLYCAEQAGILSDGNI